MPSIQVILISDNSGNIGSDLGRKSEVMIDYHLERAVAVVRREFT